MYQYKNMRCLQPITVKNMKLKNRLVMPAMGTLFGDPNTNMVSDRYLGYMEARAKGGTGLLIVEYTAVMPEGRAASMEFGLWDDRFVNGFQKLTNLVHGYGAKICVQLHHAGRSTTKQKSGWQPVAPSVLSNCQGGEEPKEITKEEIKEVIQAFADAAKRAKDAGFDCVEIHGANGYLLSQFLSPYANKRTDEYGGSLENRMRLPIEVIKSVREAVGENFPIIYRVSIAEYVKDGRTEKDTILEAKMFEAAGVDILDLSIGLLDAPEYILTGGWLEKGFRINDVAKVKSSIKIPVIGVGKLHTPELVEDAVANGKTDLVALGRALIADPEFPNKLADGRWNEIRQCVHCLNSCYDEPVNCTQNPIVGHEKQYELKSALISKNILVIGGGPAGMQAAITAAERGHKVTLWEKEIELGGQVEAAWRPPYKGDMKNIIDFRKVRLERLRVNVVVGKEASIDEIKRQKCDAVILATGSKPIIPPIKGIDTTKIFTASDILTKNFDCGKRIAIIGGGSIGAETANYLAKQGKEVYLIEMLDKIASDVPYGNRVQLMRDLEENTNLMVSSKIKEIKDTTIIVERNNNEEKIHNVDSIVIAVGLKSEKKLEKEIKEQLPEMELKVIGDAKKVRKIEYAIKEGFLAGYEI